jgi:lysophospholipase L1-like esterase
MDRAAFYSDVAPAGANRLEAPGAPGDPVAIWAAAFGPRFDLGQFQSHFVIPDWARTAPADGPPQAPVAPPERTPAPPAIEVPSWSRGTAPSYEQPAQAGDREARDDLRPSSPEGGQAYAGLRGAITRARQGGSPVRVLHFGASHTVGGIQAAKFESLLEQHAPVDYYRQAKNGVSALYPLQHRQEWLDEAIGQARPDLVVLEFGNNEAAGRVNPRDYERKFEELILEVKRRAPNASIMILGPTDGCSIRGANKGNLLPGLDDVIAAQKKVATKYGLDYFDQRQAMGGSGSVYEWRRRGLVSGDLLHFNKSGYELLGSLVYDHLNRNINS